MKKNLSLIVLLVAFTAPTAKADNKPCLIDGVIYPSYMCQQATSAGVIYPSKAASDDNAGYDLGADALRLLATVLALF